jgi:TolB-like protein
MRNGFTPLFFLVAIFGTLLLVSPARAEFKKAKIAVLDFQLQGSQFETKDMDKIVSEWLITGLVETGRFEVIERRLLEKLLEEHRLGMTGIAEPESVAQLGKILGVKVIVSGTILSFDNIVEINARLINVETGSIIAAEKVHAGSATRLNDLVSRIVEKLTLAFPLEGYIVQRTGNKAVADLGKKAGVKPGMKFIVFKEGGVMKHPKTGEVLEVETIEIGTMEITEVREKTSVGIIEKESSPDAVAYGARVRSAVKGEVISIYEEKPRSEKQGDVKKHIPMPGF